MWKFVFVICFLTIGTLAFAQKSVSKITIKQADKGYYRQSNPPKNRLVGHVVFEHDGALLYCDSAWLYSEANRVEAFSNVRIEQDTLWLYSDYLNYDGTTRLGLAKRNVKLQDPSMSLTTEAMVFDRNQNIASYSTGGTIVNQNNTLFSQIGTYFTRTQTFLFLNEVELKNPKYTLLTDTLNYQTVNRIARFTGPTRIISDSNSRIYSEKGQYDTRNDLAIFTKSNEIWNDGKQLKGDSIFYNKAIGFGQVFGHMWLLDTAQKSLVRGQLGEYTENPQTAKVHDLPYYALFDDITDTLFIHGEWLKFQTDTVGGDLLQIFPKVGIFKSDLQGRCDSLIYSSIDSSFRMFESPVLWSDESQISGDTIKLGMRNGALDSLFVLGNAFTMSSDTLNQYNQVRGKKMKGDFVDGQLHKMYSFGNGQTAYYAKEENGDYIGLYRADCSNILIHFANKKVNRVSFLVKPDSKLYPMSKIPPEEQQLSGFNPRFLERPKSKNDIFLLN